LLTSFDDYPIHQSADPIAHPGSGDPNQYDRYFFNGHQKNGEFYFAAAMGHYPVRGVIDAAFSIVHDGIEHSIFASGVMPLDRATMVGPFRIFVIEPLRTLRFLVEANDHGIEADLTFQAASVAIEEPRQQRYRDDGVVITDHTRLTQWGTWKGTISVDGVEINVEHSDVPGTRDRSWGVRPVGEQVANNRPPSIPTLFWLWAPLHFDDRFTHLALHEYPDGRRWVETALTLERFGPASPVTGTGGVSEGHDIRYEIDWEPGTREMRSAVLHFTDPEDGLVRIELEKIFTFRMRGIGYLHPYWSHGSIHGQLETGRESIALSEFNPVDIGSIHHQTLVRAREGKRVGIGVLEQFTLGPHAPTGLEGFLDGYDPSPRGARPA
jgi:hypothetical protein